MLRQHLAAHHTPVPESRAEATKAPAPKPKPRAKKTTPRTEPPAPPKRTEAEPVHAEPEQGAKTRAALREAVAEMLRAGAPQKQIMAKLGVSTRMIARTRAEYGIPYPKGPGFRFTPEQRAENERRALELLRAGATYAEVAEQVGISAPTITAIRKRAGLPSVQGRNGKEPRPRRSKAEALAECTEPYGDGHVRWAGPMAGRMPQLCAEGGKFNGRRVAFEQHHGRPPAGYVRTSCTEPACIAGPHLIDDRTPRARTEEPVTVRALQNLQAEIDQQGGPQAARDNRLTLNPPTEPETRPMPAPKDPVRTVAEGTAKALPLDQLLAWGDSHADPDVQDQAARARIAVHGLRTRYAADQELTQISDEAAQLEKRLAELRAREAELAPPKKGKRKPGARARDYDTRTVRAWAAENGVDCPRVGQIPKRVLDAWRTATTTAGGGV
ncbi:histone-like nucleoid-structuring protein Lsr2 [Streptomyces sp. NPDC007110]|uniref:helix-turn-helix domain-containing protein n=1 Tax=Streptomyces sp. NPDC007110 TaxID=3156916 RepID=UPI0033CF0E13